MPAYFDHRFNNLIQWVTEKPKPKKKTYLCYAPMLQEKLSTIEVDESFTEQDIMDIAIINLGLESAKDIEIIDLDFAIENNLTFWIL